jgi:hypothetical protein
MPVRKSSHCPTCGLLRPGAKLELPVLCERMIEKLEKEVRFARTDDEIRSFWKHQVDLGWTIDDNTIEKFLHWLRRDF